tara:strand:- start:297 stop:659 length:363 start_codon:yes stop_codon:yes gene_type:complete
MSALVVLLGQTGFGSHGRYDDDVWLHAAAARKKDSLTPGVFNRRQDTGRFDITTEYWTWGGSNNNLNTKGTPGRDICVRAMARRGSGTAPTTLHRPGTHRQRAAAGGQRLPPWPWPCYEA